MVSYFRINVALNGRYLFATEQGHLTYRPEAESVFQTIKEKFPESEGYKVTMTYWEGIGHHIYD